MDLNYIALFTYNYNYNSRLRRLETTFEYIIRLYLRKPQLHSTRLRTKNKQTSLLCF